MGLNVVIDCVSQLGFIASVPYIAYFLCINIGGFLADTVRKAHWLNTLNTRRMAMIIGNIVCGNLKNNLIAALGSQALFLVISGYCGCGQETLVMIFITVGVGLSGFQYAGYVVNYLDIAPAFAGPILGIGNTISCLAGLSPMLMGLITTEVIM
jgi:MFS family permease